MLSSATAAAHPNLAFVKYWGQFDPDLHIPANGSISVNLSGGSTTTHVVFDDALAADVVTLDGAPAASAAYARIVAHLDRVRALAAIAAHASVDSHSDFPAAVGMAASASAFAALTLAATRAAGLDLDARRLSMLARRGSGSACRSIPEGFVEWVRGDSDVSSYAFSIAAPAYWDLRVISVVVSSEPKPAASLEGHRAAFTSPFIEARLAHLPETLGLVREAIRRRDFVLLGMVAEREALSMHAVAITSRVAGRPWLSGIHYCLPETLQLIQAVQAWRAGGLPVYFTLDAGPTVHLLVEAGSLAQTLAAVDDLPGSQGYRKIVSRPGSGARLIDAAGS